MKRIVDIYIESISGSGDYSKLELFNDEKIELTSTIQNIQDISKVYTDFTQSFTVPASPHNNSVLHHFYESDVDIEQTTGTDPKNKWNFNFRIRAKVEIDLVPFRDGTIMMEKANIKNGRPDSYTLTFYGDLVSLKDKFGETKLSDLDFTAYDIDYTAANVIDRVTTTGARNIMFPLVSSKRVWTYNDFMSTDIKTNEGSIRYSELFPALKVIRIFDAIQAKFGVTFNSQFFTSTNDKWDKLYLWLKNKEDYTFMTSPVKADIVSPSGQIYTSKNVPSFYFDTVANTFTLKNANDKLVRYSELKVSISYTSDSTINYYIDLYKNGKIIQTHKDNGVVVNPFSFYVFTPQDDNAVFDIRVRAEAIMTINLNCSIYPNYTDYTEKVQTIQFNPVVTSTNTNISSDIPEMSVADFFSGILKMFNATCYATSVDVFTVEPLDMWYNQGNIFDITEYTDIDSIDIERANVYKKIAFKYQKSEAFQNRKYYDNGIMEREYADTNLTLQNEGSDLTVEVPFENLLMTNLDKTYFNVGHCLTKAPDYKPYIPKPMLFYYDDFRAANLYLNNGGSATQYFNANIFSNNVTVNGIVYSLTWHPEISTVKPLITLQNNLYAMYYSGYLQNLFNPKCRLVRVKAHFPLSLITNLRLNDRLIIRDKRYIINDLKSDITSGEVNLSLINDFRPMVNDSSIETILVSSGGGTVDIPWKVPNGAVDTTFTSPVSGVTFSPGTTTTSTTVGVTVPANTNTPTPIWTESTTDNIITDDGYGIVNEQGSGAVIPIEATNINFNGLTTVYTFNLNQE